MTIGPDGLVKRRCTGRLRIPGREEPSFKELIQGLREQFGDRAIVGVQPFGLGRFELLFGTEESLNNAVEKGFRFGGAKLDIEPAESMYKWLYAKYAPFELDQNDFKTYLAPYGEVMAMEFVYPEEMRPWHNGERKLKFRMTKAVPNYVKMGNYTVHFHYAGVVKLCRKCHNSDHMAKDCHNSNCRRCDKPGHMEADCRAVRGVNESPEDMEKIIERTRDELLRDLRAINPMRGRTGEREGANGEEQEEERAKELTRKEKEESIEDRRGEESEYETGRGDGTSEELDDHSEGMPELESEEEPEVARELQDLKKKKYTKDKEGSESEGGKNKDMNDYEETRKTAPKEAPRGKKMSKHEKRKKRQAEEKERNKKREREESESPKREEPKGKEPVKEREEPRMICREANRKVSEELEYWIYIEFGEISFGEVKERLNRQFEVGTVSIIEKEVCGTWILMFKDKRFADQAFKTGFDVYGKRSLPYARLTCRKGEKEAAPIRFRRDSDTD